MVEETVDFKYDIFGNRNEVDVTVGGTTTTTRFAYDMWNPAKAGGTGTANSDIWATFTSGGSLITRQLQGDGVDQHLAYVQSSNAYWYLTDHLNSIRAVINNSGSVQDSIVYDGYGNITYQTPSPATTPLYFYTGREFDVETGLQYNRARYYDATTGRWISQDPMGFDAGDSNLYRYVNNAPTILGDSSGMQPRPGTPIKLKDILKLPGGGQSSGLPKSLQLPGILTDRTPRYYDERDGIQTDLSGFCRGEVMRTHALPLPRSQVPALHSRQRLHLSRVGILISMECWPKYSAPQTNPRKSPTIHSALARRQGQFLRPRYLCPTRTVFWEDSVSSIRPSLRLGASSGLAVAVPALA